jgi:hypothetical protein
MSDIWESVWESISEAYRRLSVPLNSIYPGMKWACGHGDNKAFPFRAYATFNRGPVGSEDIVVSVDFHRSCDGQLRYSTDVGLDDGQVLADGPAGMISIAAGLVAAAPEIDAAVQKIVAFIDASGPVMRRAMERGQS